MSSKLIAWTYRLGRWIINYNLLDKHGQAYLITLLLMMFALAMRLLIAPVDQGLQYVTFFPAVTLAAVLGGWRPGLLATVIGALLATWIFNPPYWGMGLEKLGLYFWPNLVFLVDGCIVSFSINGMHRYRREYQAELAQAQAAEQVTSELNKELRRLVQRHDEDNAELQKFQAIVQSSEDAIISKSLDGIVQSWNPAAEKIFGYSAAEVLGQPMTLMFPPGRSHEEGDVLARIGRAERVEPFETVRRHKDGRLIEVSVAMSPLLDKAGRVVGATKMARDISWQKEMQMQIDSFFDLSLDIMSIASEDGYFKRVNPGLTHALGWSEQELLAQPYLNFVHPDDVEHTVREVERQVKNGERVLHFENRYKRKEDGWRTLSWVSAPGANGLMYATARDVTDEKIRQQQLLDEATRIQTILDSVADGIITINGRGLVETFNPAAEKIFGYAATEVVGRNVSLLMPEPYHSEHDGYLARYHETGEGHIIGVSRAGGLEVVGLRKDGSTFTMSLAVNEITLAQQKYYVGIVHDITERKQHEQLLKNAKEQAEQAGHVKASFLASMSHEIRTPLGGMLGMLELLSLSNLDAEQMATLDTAWASGRGLLRIVNDILDWSKIEEGKLHIDPIPTALGSLLQEAVNTYSRVASTKSLMLWQHVDSRLVHAYMLDQLRLSQVLNNFTSNAIKFSDRGEIELRAELLEETAQGDVIRFSVKDTGIGIAEEDHDKIFQNYAQASADTARMYGGTGLGLAICRRLAEMMEGELGLVSQPNRGSTFSITLTLPRTDAMVVAAAPRQVEEAQRAIKPLFSNGEAAPLVLVVDDHPTNRELLARQVKILGLRAKTAENGRVGVSLWRDGRYAMIISDCHMPDMDGYEMARTIRKLEAQENRARTPIIAWTANALSEEQEHINNAGMDELLVKPVNLLQLRHMLKKWLLPNTDSTGAEALPAQAPIPSASLPNQAYAGATDPIDHAVLDTIMNDPAEQKKLLHDFVAHIRTDRARLGELLTQQDNAAVQSAAHRMKGSCRMVGAGRLGEACAGIETAARQGDLGGAQTLLATLDDMLSEVAEFVE